MKRILSLICAIGLLLSAAAGLSSCKPKETDTGDADTISLSVLMSGMPVEKSYKYRDQVMEAINKKLFADLGFKVNVKTTTYVDQFDTMLALDLASGVNYDMIRTMPNTAASYMEKNVFRDLKPLLPTYAPDILNTVPASVFAEDTLNGMIYGIPTCSFPIEYGMWFRGDWLQKLGKTVPTSLSELEALMEALKTNKELNSKNKVVPMAGHNGFLEQVFLGFFTDHPGDYLENDKVLPKHFDPGYRKYTEKVAEWYKKGYVDDLILNGDENVINDLLAKDRIGVHVGNVYQLEYSTMKSYNEQKNMDMRWSIPFAADTKTYYSTGCGSDIIAFPATSKVTEKALQFYNWYYNNNENADLVFFGIEGVTYNKSTDPVTGKPYIVIPEAEVTEKIKTPAHLIGPIGSNVYTTQQLMYTFADRPAESARAYDACNTKEVLDNFHMDVTRYFQQTQTGTLGTKFEDARNMLIKRTTEMMVGKRPSTDAEWAAMKTEWERLGGKDSYDFSTQEYLKAKSTLTFLK